MKNIKIIFVILCLIGSSIVTIATSKKSDIPVLLNSNYGSASNCSNATVTNQAITVTSAGIIVAPEMINFRNLGLPVTSLKIATDTAISGAVGTVVRSCSYSLNTTSGTLHVYSCTDDGTPSCQVSFTPL